VTPTPSVPPGKLPSTSRGASSAGVTAIVLLALGSPVLSGCASHLQGKLPEAVARAEAPKLSATQKQVEEVREQAALAPDEPYWPYRLAEIYVEADSATRAEAALATCLRRDATYAPALALLSRLYYRSGRHAEGVALLEAARTRTSAAPGGMPPALLACLALHYEALGRHDLAAVVVAEAERTEPGPARSALVYVTLRGENPDSADGPARAAVDDDPRSAPAQNNYGITRLRAGDPKGARSAFLRAIELDPALPGPYYNLAILERFYLFDDDAAARWLAAYRERSSDDPDGLFRLMAGAGSGAADGKGQR